MTNAVTLCGVSKKYRGNWGLRDCSINIPDGCVAALVGPNGAGKSTLLNLLIGLIAPTTGAMSIFGAPVTGSGVREGVSFLSQHHPLYKSFTVQEMLRVGRVLNTEWDQDLAVNRLAELNIPLSRKTGRLSGGQRAQVALAIALASKPRLLLLDEPIAALDPLARKEFMGVVMEEVATNKTTVVISSHIVAELERFCDYMIIIQNGTPRLTDHTDTLMSEHHRLTGPINTPIPPKMEIIDRYVKGNLETLLGRAEVTPQTPGWTVEDPTLEDIVMKYLEQKPDNTKTTAVTR